MTIALLASVSSELSVSEYNSAKTERLEALAKSFHVDTAAIRSRWRRNRWQEEGEGVRHSASKQVAQYNKLLIPRERLAEVRRIAGEARRVHHFMTLPWDDSGYRVLPAAVYLEHVEKLRGYSRMFTAAVEVFAAQFDQLVIKSRSRLGGLFRPEDYPASGEIRDKFGFETKVMPLPDADDFRVSLGDEEKDRVKRQIAASVEASLAVASRELWQRMYEAVSHMAERLSAYKATGQGVESPFRDSIVTNLVKLVDVMPRLNVTGDPELERLTEQVRASLLVDPAELRKSESVRADTAIKASKIVAQMSAYMGGYQPAAMSSETTTMNWPERPRNGCNDDVPLGSLNPI